MSRHFQFFKVRRLQVDIITAFSFLFILTSIIIISVTYTKSSDVILLFSKKILNGLEKDTTHHLSDLLDSAQYAVEEGEILIRNESQISLGHQVLLQYMLGILKFNSNFDNYYIGTETGSFLEVMRLYENIILPPEFPPAPIGSKYAIRSIDRRTTPLEVIWIFLNENFKQLEEKKWNIVQYDPRLRPWYVTTTQPGQISWTNIYIFNESLHRGISASTAVYRDNKVIGVVGVDLSLEKLNEFLSEEPIGKSGQSILLTKTGQIIAASFDLQLKDEKQQPPLLEDLENPLFAAAYAYSQEKNLTSFIFKYQGTEYLSLFTTINFNLKEPWIMGIVVPMSDFLENVIKINHHLIAILFIIFIISVIFIYFLARKIAKPIVQLTFEIDKIREFKLDRQINIPSHIKEIIQITQSVSTMKSAIKEFSHFVPKQLVEQLIMKGHSIQLGGNREEITIFFSDIFSFTSISEKMSPEKLVLHLSEYLNEMSAIIMSHHGTIDKYSGDNIMAFWGAPSHDKDQILHACTTALLCQKRLSILNQKWEKEGKPLLLTRIGIHTGEVIVGNIGSSDRMNYTVIGDPVNVASRLESINKIYHTAIIISEQVFEKIDNLFLARPIDIVSVRGKTIGIKIYELVAKLKGESSLIATQSQIEFCQKFTEAFNTFHARKWEEALKLFESFSQDYPEDAVVQIYIERSKNFMKNPPPQDWNGKTPTEKLY